MVTPCDCNPANFHSPANSCCGSAAAALELAVADEALAAVEAEAAEPDVLADAAKLDALPPQAASAKQHTHSMDAHSNARYFFMMFPFLWFPPWGKVTMTQALKLRGFKTV